MTRSENMEHVEVLRELRDTGDVSDWRAMESALDAALASLSAQQPPAEAQPVACDEDRFEQFLQAAIARSPEPLRELGEYLSGVLDDDQWPAADRLLLQLATAPPSAPVGVEGEAKARLFCLAEEEISSGTLDDLIDEAIDSDIVEPGDTLRVEEWVRIREFEVGPEDDERLAAQQGGSDNDR